MSICVTHVGSSVTTVSSSSSMACLCHTGLASTGSVSAESFPEGTCYWVFPLAASVKNLTQGGNITIKKKSPTYGFIAGHGHETLLLDVGFGGGVAATGMKPSIVDAQHHPVAETLATGHCALEERQHITMSLSMLYHFSFRFQQIAPNQSDKWIAWAAMSI